MTEDRKNIDRLFKESLSGYRVKAPVNAWQQLDNELNRRDRKKALIFFRLAAASVLILMAFAAGYFYAMNFSNPSTVADDSQNAEPSVEITEINGPVENSSDTDMESLLSKNGKDSENADSSAGDDDLKSVAETSLTSNNMANDGLNVWIDEQDGTGSTLAANIVDGTVHKIKRVYPEVIPVSSNSEYFAGIELQNAYASVVVFREEREIPMGYQSDPIKKEKEYVYSGLPENAQKLKWTIGAQVAPTVSFRDISTNYTGDPSQNISERNNLNQSEEALHSYSGGLQVALAMNDKWGFQSGMYFSRIGQVSNDALQFKEDSKGFILYGVNTSAGAVNVRFEKVPSSIRSVDSPKDTLPPGNIQNVKIIQNFDLFEIPFLINYHLLNKKFSIKLAGGLSPAYLVDNKTSLELDNSNYEIGDASNLNSFIINSSVGLGIGYEFVKKVTFSLEPTFKYSLSPINRNSDFDYHPYYMSWFTGIKYTF